MPRTKLFAVISIQNTALRMFFTHRKMEAISQARELSARHDKASLVRIDANGSARDITVAMMKWAAEATNADEMEIKVNVRQDTTLQVQEGVIYRKGRKALVPVDTSNAGGASGAIPVVPGAAETAPAGVGG